MCVLDAFLLLDQLSRQAPHHGDFLLGKAYNNDHTDTNYLRKLWSDYYCDYEE